MNEYLWALGRATGTIAFVLFTVSVASGVATRSARDVSWIGRVGVADIHRTTSLSGAVLVTGHVTTLYLDPYSQLHLLDVVAPFLAEYRPLWVGLGTAALDTLAVVTAVSLLRHRIGPCVFHAVHLTVYVLWPMVFLHGIFSGTDAGSRWLITIWLGCGATVLAAAWWRLAGRFGDFRDGRRQPLSGPARSVDRSSS